MPKSRFSRRVGNEEEGTEVNRLRLFYSPKNNTAYYFCYLRQFSTKSSFVTSADYNKRKKKGKLNSHEISQNH